MTRWKERKGKYGSEARHSPLLCKKAGDARFCVKLATINHVSFGASAFYFCCTGKSIHFVYYLADIPFISFLTKLIICYHSTAGCSNVHSLTQRETRWLPPTTQAIIGTGDLTQHAGTRRKPFIPFRGVATCTKQTKKCGISPWFWDTSTP